MFVLVQKTKAQEKENFLVYFCLSQRRMENFYASEIEEKEEIKKICVEQFRRLKFQSELRLFSQLMR